MAASSPARAGRPYSPAQHLLAHWSAAELITQFQWFRNNLQYVKNAPELVFERLVGSLNHGFDKTASQERADAVELRRQNKELNDSVALLRVELTELHAKHSQQRSVKVTQVSSGSGSSSTIDLARTSSGSIPTIAIEEHWDRLVFKLIATEKEVHTICKSSTPTSPIALGGCTWAAVGRVHPDFQSGQETFERYPGSQLTSSNLDVRFPKRYRKPTEVVVWLTHIDYRGPFSVHVSGTEQSETGFTLKLEISNTGIVQSIGVAWVAYPTNAYSFQTGSMSTQGADDWNCWKCPKSSFSGIDGLNLDIDSATKRFVVVNALDVGECDTLSLETSSAIISLFTDLPTLEWKITVGPADACLYSAGISYLVVL